MLAVNDRPELRRQNNQRINAILLHIKTTFVQLFNAFGDQIYKVIFNSPTGKWIMTLATSICEFLNCVVRRVGKLRSGRAGPGRDVRARSVW